MSLLARPSYALLLFTPRRLDGDAAAAEAAPAHAAQWGKAFVGEGRLTLHGNIGEGGRDGRFEVFEFALD